jgi:hypothetical protein
VWREWEPVSIPDPKAKRLPDFELLSHENTKFTLLYTAGLWDQLGQLFLMLISALEVFRSCFQVQAFIRLLHTSGFSL